MITLTGREGSRGAGYGAIELKLLHQWYWGISLGIAIVIHLGIVGSYYLLQLLQPVEPPMVHVNIMRDYWKMGPPPRTTSVDAPPPISVSGPAAKVRAGVPVPVPPGIVDTEQTIPKQIDMNKGESPLGEGPGEYKVDPRITISEPGPPEDVVFVEKLPVVAKKVEPHYPELAIKAGLEGSVWVKLWVDKEGKVRQAVVLKSDADIFNEPAVEAAKQFVFTPAYMNNGPVAVWVSLPFRFRLAEKKQSGHGRHQTDATRLLYSLSAAARRSFAVVSPGSLWVG